MIGIMLLVVDQKGVLQNAGSILSRDACQKVKLQCCATTTKALLSQRIQCVEQDVTLSPRVCSPAEPAYNVCIPFPCARATSFTRWEGVHHITICIISIDHDLASLHAKSDQGTAQDAEVVCQTQLCESNPEWDSKGCMLANELGEGGEQRALLTHQSGYDVQWTWQVLMVRKGITRAIGDRYVGADCRQ